MQKNADQVLDILRLARRNNIALLVDKGKLSCRIPKGQQRDPELMEEIVRLKEEIILFLGKQADEVPPIDNHRSRGTRIPLSYNQERLWFIHQLEGSRQYHMTWRLRVKGALNVDVLRDSFRALVNRHEVLRTVLREEDGSTYQHVLDKGQWELVVMEVRSEDASELASLIVGLMDRAFDLSTDHPLRVHVIPLSGGDHILLINVHHIAADAWSWNILIRELNILYGSFVSGNVVALESLPVQYADYALWQRRYLQGAVLEAKLQYWERQLSGAGVLNLPTDYARSVSQSREGGHVSRFLEGALVKSLRDLSRESEVTLFMLCLAVYKVLLYRYSGQEDISVGSPIAGRTQRETEGLIGFFVNTLVLRSDLGGNPRFVELLQKVKQMTLDSYEHQDVPFEKLVEKLVTDRDLSRHPLFQVVFAMQTVQEGKESQLILGDTELTTEPVGLSRSKFDLMLTVREARRGLDLSIEYSKDLYAESTIESMLTHYQQLLHAVVGD
jgi:hypothetical protein